jgi:hypothetical protein
MSVMLKSKQQGNRLQIDAKHAELWHKTQVHYISDTDASDARQTDLGRAVKLKTSSPNPTGSSALRPVGAREKNIFNNFWDTPCIYTLWRFQITAHL